MASRKLQVEFVGDTADLERAFKRAGRSTDQFASRQSAIAGRLAGAMKVAGAAGVAGLAVGLKKSVDVAMSFERQMSKLGAVTDATGRQMDRLKRQALDMGAKTKFSAQEAAAAQTELAKGGMTVQQVLKGGLQGSLSLAAAGEMELADAAATTTNALNTFKMSAGQAGRVADMLATAANATTADVADFAEALSNGGTAAKAVGWDLKQTTVALEALAQIGVKGGEAGTTLKSAMIALSKPTKKQAEAASELGLKFFDAHGKMKSVAAISAMLRDKLGGLTKQQKLATMSTIAGSYGMRGLLAIMDAGPEKLKAYGKGLDKQGTAAKVAAKMQDNLAGKLETLGGALETIGIKVGGVLIPPLTAATVAVTRLLDGIGGSLDHLGSLFDGLGGKVGGVTGPLGSLAQTFSTLGASIGRTASQTWAALSKIFDAKFVQDLRSIGAALLWLGAQVAKVVGGVIGRQLAGMAQAFRGVAQIIRGVVAAIAGILTLDFAKAWDGAKMIVSGALTAIIGQVRAATAPMREVAQRLGTVALVALRSAWSALSGVASKAWSAVTGAISAAAGAVKGAAGAVGRAGLAALRAAWNGIKAIATAAFQRLANGIRAEVKAVTGAATAVADSVWGAVKSLPTKFVQLGKDMIQGLINGVRSLAGAAKDAILDVVTSPYRAAKHALGIGSPSKVFHEIGQNIGRGLINGITAMSAPVAKAAAAIATAATAAATKTVGSKWLFPLEAKLRQLEAIRDRAQQSATRTSSAGVAVSRSGLPVIAGGRLLQALGLQVAESKYFGGVTTSRHAHYTNDHYSGNSIDVNYPGGGPAELRKLQAALTKLQKTFGATVKAFVEDAGTANQHLHATFQAAFPRAKASRITGGGSRYNSVYRAHPTGTSGPALSPGEVMALAMQAGFTKTQARQVVRIAKGESNFMPGIFNSQDNGMGLLQMTPIAGGWGSAAKRKLAQLGGIDQMRNPLKNLQMAKWLFDREGWQPWNLTRYGNSGLYSNLEPAALKGGGGGGAGSRQVAQLDLRIQGLEKVKAFRDAIRGVRDMIADKLNTAVDKFGEKWERTVGQAIDKANQLKLAQFDAATDQLVASTPAAQRLAALRAIDDLEARAEEDSRNQQALSEAMTSGTPEEIAAARRQIEATARAREEVALEQQVALETEQIQRQRADEREQLEQQMAANREKRKNDDVKTFRSTEKKKLDALVASLRNQAISYKRFYLAVRPILKEMGVPVSKFKDFNAETEAAIAGIGGSFAGGGVVPGPLGAPMLATVHGGELIYDPRTGTGPRATGGPLVNIERMEVSSVFDEERFARRLLFQLQTASL